MRTLSAVLIGSTLFLANSGLALAAPGADLQVQLQGPASAAISTPATYTVSVKNAGPATADGIQVSVTLPLTDTSPSVSVLGTVSALDPRCSVVSHKLQCALGSLKKNKTATFTYAYAAPVSTKTLRMTAKITASSASDANAGNNEASLVPNLSYPARPITSAAVSNSHCTGTNLTSYFECLLYPSSLSSHDATLNAGGGITLTEPGYTGNWSQNAAKTTLFFEYFDTNGKIAEFNGFAINGGNCFDGLTTFFPVSSYVSPYRVCIR